MVFTKDQIEKFLPYYQSKLDEWELYVVFHKKSNEEIFNRSEPDIDSLYDIRCKKGLINIAIENAIKEFNLLQPYQVY